MKIQVLRLFVWTLFLCGTGSLFGQISKEVLLYRRVAKIKLFQPKPENIKAIIGSKSVKKSETDGAFLTERYDMNGAKVTITYSTGRCTEHGSKLGYDATRGTVIGVDLFFYEDYKLKQFGFDLSKFSKYVNTEGNYVIYRDEGSGILLTGGDDQIRSIEFLPTEADERRYHCSNS
jgi:hypothetical protein